MSVCPHCNKSGISFLRRACLGPLIPATCSVCGGKVGVPMGKSMLAFAPFLAALVGAQVAPTQALSFLAWIVGAAIMIVLHFKYVPLIKLPGGSGGG